MAISDEEMRREVEGAGLVYLPHCGICDGNHLGECPEPETPLGDLEDNEVDDDGRS